MKVAAIIVNFLFPGVGSLMIGKTGAGITQLLMFLFGLLLMVTVIGAIFGWVFMFVAWVWALVTAAQFEEAPKVVHLVPQPEPDAKAETS